MRGDKEQGLTWKVAADSADVHVSPQAEPQSADLQGHKLPIKGTEAGKGKPFTSLTAGLASGHGTEVISICKKPAQPAATTECRLELQQSLSCAICFQPSCKHADHPCPGQAHRQIKYGAEPQMYWHKVPLLSAAGMRAHEGQP